MAHYDLYESLGIERSASSTEIIGEIERRLAEGRTDNLGGVEELKLATRIFEDDEKRRLYDSRIADPDVPEVGVEAIRELANLNLSGAGENPNRSEQRSSRLGGATSTINSARNRATAEASKVQGHYKKSSRTAIVVTAVAVAIVTALVTAGAFMLLGGGGSGALSGGNVRGAENKAEEFLELRTAQDARTWIGNNTHPSDRQSMVSRLGLGDNGDFTGADVYFDGPNPQVDYALDVMPIFQGHFRLDEEGFQRALESEGLESIAEVKVKDDNGVSLGSLNFYKINDNWVLAGVSKSVEVDEDDFDLGDLR